MNRGTAYISLCLADNDRLTCQPYQGTLKDYQAYASSVLGFDPHVQSMTLVRIRYRGAQRPISSVIKMIDRSTAAEGEAL